MKIKLNKEENEICLKCLGDYLDKYCNIKQHEEKMHNIFNRILKPYGNGRYLKIINEFYIDDVEYGVLKEHIMKKTILNYIEIKYKKLLIINDDINEMYYVNTNNNDINTDNIVQNGTLIFRLQRVLNFNSNIKERKKIIRQLNNYVKLTEKKLSTELNVPVRILYYDIVNPPTGKI